MICILIDNFPIIPEKDNYLLLNVKPNVASLACYCSILINKSETLLAGLVAVSCGGHECVI